MTINEWDTDSKISRNTSEFSSKDSAALRAELHETSVHQSKGPAIHACSETDF